MEDEESVKSMLELGLERKLYFVADVTQWMSIYGGFREAQAELKILEENTLPYENKLKECAKLFDMYKKFVLEEVKYSLRGSNPWVNFETVFESFLKEDEKVRQKR